MSNDITFFTLIFSFIYIKKFQRHTLSPTFQVESDNKSPTLSLSKGYRLSTQRSASLSSGGEHRRIT